VFELQHSFYGRENPALTDQLLGEAPAIFNWALTGLDRLNQRGYFKAPKSEQDAVRQLEDLSSPIGAFVRDRCAVRADASIKTEDAWTLWKSWCTDENRAPGTKAVFGRDLKAAFPQVDRQRPRHGDDREYVYQGLGRREHYVAEDLEPLGPDGPSDPSGPSGPSDSAMYPPHSRPSR